MGKKYFVWGLVIVGMIAFAGFLAMNANANGLPNEVWVDDNAVPGWYDSTHVKTIQEGITNVSAGGTVHVWNGTYTENVDVGKTVSIIGNGSASCVVQAAISSDHVFEVTADWVNISGFTIKNATGSQKDGVFLDNVVHCNISNSKICNNNNGIAAGKVSSSSSSYNIIFNNQIVNNSFYGIDIIWHSNNNRVIHNTFINNYEGIDIHYTSNDNSILNNTVYSNRFDGIHILSGSSNNIVFNNTITNNKGKGMYIYHSSTINNTIISNKICNNSGDGINIGGGAKHNNLLSNYIYNNSDGIHFINAHYNNITLNNVYDNSGHGVYLRMSNDNNISDNTIFNNTGTDSGIHLDYSDGNNITGNNITGNDHGIYVNHSYNVTMKFNNISNNNYGIYCNDSSGFTISNNTFWYDDWGLYLDIVKTGLAEDYIFYESMIAENEFFADTDNCSIRMLVGLEYNYGNYDVTIEDISIVGNTFYMNESSGTAYGIQMGRRKSNTDAGYTDGGIYVKKLNGGNVYVDMVNISGNNIYGGGLGINFGGEYMSHRQSCFYEFTNVTVTAGDVIVTNNTLLNQYYWNANHGIRIDYYDALYWNGTTTGTFGDLIISHNFIRSSHNIYGIRVDEYNCARYFEDSASLTTGNLLLEYNEIDTGSSAMIVYYIDSVDEFSQDAQVTMHDLFVRHNTIHHAVGCGISIDIDEFEEFCNDSSATTGDIFIINNTVNVTSTCLYFDFGYVGYELQGNASMTIGNIHIHDNDFITTSSSGSVYLYFDEYVACYLTDYAELIFGYIELDNNSITGQGNGIHIETYDYYTYDMYDESAAYMPDYIIRNNTITVFGIGIYLTSYSISYDIYNNTYVYFGVFLIDNNTIDSGGIGVYLDYAYMCNSMYGSSSTKIGDVTITNNEVHAGGNAIDIYFDDTSYGPYEQSSVIIGNITVERNIVDCLIGISVHYHTVYAYDNSTVTVGNLSIIENDISDCRNEGIEVYYYPEAHDNSTITFGQALIQGNIIDNCSTGIYILRGGSSDATAAVTLGGPVIGNNIISNCRGTKTGIHLKSWTDTLYYAIISNNTLFNSTYGIYLDESVNYTTIENNTISNCSHGIYLEDSSNNTIIINMIRNNAAAPTGLHVDANSNDNEIHMNCFIDNIPQAWDDGTNNNWTGNYWSDYPVEGGTYNINGTAGSADNNTLGSCPLLPTANFTHSPPNPDTSDTIRFTDQSSDLDGIIVSWYWEFGDGDTSYEQNPTHQYADDGTYQVNLTVIDDDGATDMFSVGIEVSLPPAQVPAMTPIGILILIGLVSILAVIAIKKKQK